jgi:hypothetical protein
MAKPLRIACPGAFYHVTPRCLEQKDEKRDQTLVNTPPPKPTVYFFSVECAFTTRAKWYTQRLR